jgi:outer membrane immunogenic protein
LPALSEIVIDDAIAESITDWDSLMKRFAIAVGLSIVISGGAFAADMPAVPPPPAFVPVATVYNWGGAYFGINGGYAFGTSSWENSPSSSGHFNITGGAIGGTAGANVQAGAFVFGAETDFDYAPVKGSTPSAFCAACQTSTTWLGTTRARAGYAADRVLFYGTAGIAYSNLQASAFGASETRTRVGWVAGGGVEMAFTDNWTGRLEYLFVDLQDGSCAAACAASLTGPQPVTFAESLVRAGIDCKFKP